MQSFPSTPLRAARDFLRWTRWQRALPEEVSFWDEWFETKGGEWPEDYVRRMDAQGELQENLKEILFEELNVPEDGSVSILDVGAGPITRLGYHWGKRSVKLTATDALARQYNALLLKHSLTPPSKTIACSAESLSKRFEHDTFDMAYCRNALDHSYSPLKAIREMLKVVRPGGLVVLEHYVNEAEGSGYHGLHQWNFDVQEGRLTVWGKRARLDIARGVADLATVEVEKKTLGRPWVLARLTKLTTASSSVR